MFKARRIIYSVLVASALGFFTSSCKDDVDQRFPFFELVVDANYSFNEERWVIATDADGRVLDASAYTTGKTVQLRSTNVVTSPFTITLLSHCNDCSVRHFNFTSYCEITPGSKWSLAWPSGARKALPTENAGKVSVEVSNLPSPIRLNPLGDNYFITSSFNANSIGYKEPYGGPLILFDVWLRNKPADILLQAVSNGESRLFRFPVDSTMKGKGLKFDYLTDFSLPDHVFTIQPMANISWQSFRIDGYLLPLSEVTELYKNHSFSNIYDDSKRKLTIGFNDGYKSYLTTWSRAFEPIYNKHKFLLYYKLGDPPTDESFLFPSVDFIVTDDDFNDFDFVASGDFAYFKSNWYSNDFKGFSVTWEVTAPTNSKNRIMTELPEGIAKRYGLKPDFLSKLEYDRSSFTINVSNNSYNHLIDKMFSAAGFQYTPNEYFELRKY